MSGGRVEPPGSVVFIQHIDVANELVTKLDDSRDNLRNLHCRATEPVSYWCYLKDLNMSKNLIKQSAIRAALIAGGNLKQEPVTLGTLLRDKHRTSDNSRAESQAAAIAARRKELNVKPVVSKAVSLPHGWVATKQPIATMEVCERTKQFIASKAGAA